jgi:hypothetical protein
MQKWRSIFSQPFPEQNTFLQNTVSLGGIGLFIALFLYLFQPFGMGNTRANLLLICLGFGLVTFVCGFLFDLFLRFVLRIHTDIQAWTFGKWLLTMLLLLIFIAIGNYFYINWLAGRTNWDFFGLLQVTAYTFLIGLFPVLFSGLMIKLKSEKAFKAEAGKIHPSAAGEIVGAETIDFRISAREEVKIPVRQLRYLEVVHNYVQVYYVEAEQLKQLSMRTTISQVEKEIRQDHILRCHRSFMVNLHAIEAVEGNAQGLKLKLRQVSDKEIPVSRTYIPLLREKVD